MLIIVLRLELNKIDLLDTFNMILHLTEDIKLVGLCQTVVECRGKFPENFSMSGLFEPGNVFKEKYSVLPAKTLVSKYENTMLLSILNPYNTVIKLYKGTKIRTVESIDYFCCNLLNLNQP